MFEEMVLSFNHFKATQKLLFFHISQVNDLNTMLCPIKENSNTIELLDDTSCFCVLDLLCVTLSHFSLLFESPFLVLRQTLAICMSPVSPVFHTEATVSIGLKNVFRVGTSIP